MLKVISVNKYYTMHGGADREMFNLERVLLSHGHEVAPFCVDVPGNMATTYGKYFPSSYEWSESASFTLAQNVKGFLKIVYNFEAKKKLARLVADFGPDIAHIHNIHYDVSPSVIDTLKGLGVPVVMHLHDSRLFCPNGVMFTEHQYCNRCLYHKYYHAALHRCLNHSLKGSIAASVAFYVHRWLRVWTEKVDRYIVPTKIVREMAIESGIDSRKIDLYTYPAPLDSVQPSWVYENYILFFGYHAEQKGIYCLLEAMAQLKSNVKLKICGKGPETGRIKEFVSEKGLENVEIIGFVSDESLHELLSRCLFVVLPSIGFENSNALIREANSAGKAVLGSDRGGIPELIIDGQTGLIYESSNVSELSRKIDELVSDVEGTIRLGRNARALVERECDEQVYYRNILDTYEKAGRRER